MLSGRDGLQSLEEAIRALRAEERELSDALQRLGEARIALRERYAARVKDLARFRLDRLMSDSLARDLDRADGRVRDLLARRRQAIEEAEARARDRERELEAVEARRTERAAALEQLSEALDRAAAALQQRLAGEPAYAAQLAAVEAAEAVARKAEEKTRTAEQDRAEKGRPYEDDPLFRYLWERGYGTARYRSCRIARMLDEWVARLCRYHAARPNYAMLLELPQRLAEHAGRMRAAVEAALAALTGLEQAAREASELPALDARVAEARAALEALDEEIAAAKAEAARSESQLNRFRDEEDELAAEALELLVSTVESREIRELRRAALETPQPDDERIVRDLAEIDDELEAAESDRAHARDLLHAKQRRRNELEDMRVEFRRRHFDDYGSQFPDGNLFGSVLEEFLKGAIAGAAYWGRLERGRRYRPRRSRADFGSGQFQLPGPIVFPDFPEPGRGSSPFPSGPDIGDFGDDDFKTGGGF